MDNVCRKAFREIQDHIIQIRDFMKDNPKSTGFEVDVVADNIHSNLVE